MTDWTEPAITVNGTPLTTGQAMRLLIARALMETGFCMVAARRATARHRLVADASRARSRHASPQGAF